MFFVKKGSWFCFGNIFVFFPENFVQLACLQAIFFFSLSLSLSLSRSVYIYIHTGYMISCFTVYLPSSERTCLRENHQFLIRSYHVILVFGPVYQMLFFWTLAFSKSVYEGCSKFFHLENPIFANFFFLSPNFRELHVYLSRYMLAKILKKNMDVWYPQIVPGVWSLVTLHSAAADLNIYVLV